jgi:hypothetical protein
MTNALPTSPASCRAGMHRRRFLLTSLAGTLAAPLAAEAQQAGRVPRVALLSTAGILRSWELSRPKCADSVTWKDGI